MVERLPPVALVAACCLLATLLVGGCTTSRYVAVGDNRFGPVDVGDTVSIETSQGEEITGEVTARRGDALVVDGRSFILADIATLQVRRSDPARTGSIAGGAAAGVVLGPVAVVGLLLLFAPVVFLLV